MKEEVKVEEFKCPKCLKVNDTDELCDLCWRDDYDDKKIFSKYVKERVFESAHLDYVLSKFNESKVGSSDVLRLFKEDYKCYICENKPQKFTVSKKLKVKCY